MDTIKVKLISTHPLLMQKDTLANPLHPVTKEHKEVSSKRKKTEEDYEWLLWSEWRASMYHDAEIGPYMPTLNIEACIIAAAKINRLGTAVKQGVLIEGDKARLEYDGPRDMQGLWDSKKFADMRAVVIQKSRVQRCRPIFLKWSLQCEVMFMPDVIGRDELIRCIHNAGARIGLGTYRPRFGRFSAEILK